MAPFESLPYRPCAGLAVFNRDGLVFIGRRTGGPERYQARYVLVRPDQFVAWAGDEVSPEPASLLRKAAGVAQGSCAQA